MSSPAAVLGQLRSLHGTLHPALRQIADIVLDDPSQAATLSIGQLAESAGASQASVVRLARDLGFSGYREFRFALRAELAYTHGREASEADAIAFGRLNRDIDPSDTLSQVVAKIAFTDARAVTETAQGVDLEQLEQIIDVLSSARRIATFGVGASAFAATDLQQKLSRIGLQATTYLDAHEGVAAASLLEPGDAAVGISHGGDTIDVVDAVRIAAQAGAATVGLTNTPSSPLVQLSDHSLLTAAQESPFRSGATASRLAQLALVDIIFVGIAQRHYDTATAALARTRAAVSTRRLTP